MLSCRGVNIQNVKVFEVWLAWLRSFLAGEQCTCDHMEVLFISFYRSDAYYRKRGDEKQTVAATVAETTI